jgi:hypothetical protein
MLAGTEDLDLDGLAGLVGWEATAHIAYTFRKPHRSHIVAIEPCTWRCPHCRGYIYQRNSKSWNPSAYGYPQCVQCKKFVHPRGSDGAQDVHIDIADYCPQPRDGVLGEVRRILGKELEDMERSTGA